MLVNNIFSFIFFCVCQKRPTKENSLFAHLNKKSFILKTLIVCCVILAYFHLEKYKSGDRILILVFFFFFFLKIRLNYNSGDNQVIQLFDAFTCCFSCFCFFRWPEFWWRLARHWQHSSSTGCFLPFSLWFWHTERGQRFFSQWMLPS